VHTSCPCPPSRAVPTLASRLQPGARSFGIPTGVCSQEAKRENAGKRRVTLVLGREPASLAIAPRSRCDVQTRSALASRTRRALAQACSPPWHSSLRRARRPDSRATPCIPPLEHRCFHRTRPSARAEHLRVASRVPWSRRYLRSRGASTASSRSDGMPAKSTPCLPTVSSSG
jgi:hypothetical protein